MRGGHRPSAGETEQERRLSDLGSQWRNHSGATPQSPGCAAGGRARRDIARHRRRSVDAAENIGSMRVFRILTDVVEKVGDESGGALDWSLFGEF